MTDTKPPPNSAAPRRRGPKPELSSPVRFCLWLDGETFARVKALAGDEPGKRGRVIRDALKRGLAGFG